MELSLDIPTEVSKKLFRPKPIKSNGLVLKIHHTLFSKRTRFVHSCFNHFHNILGLANNQDNIFIIDYSANKFWGLQQSHSSTFIEFSPLTDFHILTGIDNGDILICNMHTGQILGKLIGHKFSVKNVSFAKKNLILSASAYEAIIWDLESTTKLQVLNLDEDCSLKYVTYIPVSGNVLACFQDDLIQIWSHEKYENLKQFSPTNWNKCFIKSISFTKNGQIMVIAGQLPTLSVFHLETSKLLKTISLADYLQTIRCTAFVSQPYDGGCNNILVVLSGQGVLFFVNIEDDVVVSELKCEMEIHRFVCSPNGNYIICLLSSGEVLLFNIQQYVFPPIEVRVQKVRKKFKVNRKKCLEEIRFVKDEIDNLLDVRKLKFVLKEYGEFPDIYRTKIWERLLQLPINLNKYNSVINHVTMISFDNLYEKYPLEDKMFLKRLKKLLNNIVTWCPFFANVDYLPVFTFPFVKVFHNKPLACFEAVCTVILNWCQHWFEYFPLSPINVLAIAENILLEHDPELLHHFVTTKISSNIYIWCLLETVFSEVLTSTEWLTLWDHILINEVSFLLCTTVAYNMVQRSILLSLKTLEHFECFFKNQNPVDLRRLIKVSYCVLDNTSEKFHPRQYFKNFVNIEKNNYPLFIGYPSKIVECQKREVDKLDKNILGLLAEQKRLNDKNVVISDIITDEEKEEEKKRLKQMEKVYTKQLKLKRHILDLEQKKLEMMKKALSKKNMKRSNTFCHDKLDFRISTKSKNVPEKSDKRKGNDEQCKDVEINQKKLEMAINVELVDKFIKKIEKELKNVDSNKRNVLEVNKPTHRNKYGTLGECKRHDTEDCLCDNVCQKTVRFSESTTGGSVD